MLDTIPNEEEMMVLVGKPLYAVWNSLCALIDDKYDMERLWNKNPPATLVDSYFDYFIRKQM